MTNLNERAIVEMYDKENLSTYAIAIKYNTYPNKIRRILKRNGMQMKTKSEAQKIAIASGRHEHPTEGKQRDEDTKRKISESVYNYWQNMSQEQREKRVTIAKEQWLQMSQEERDMLKKLAAEAVRKASKDGSKMEKFLRKNLTLHGYDVIFHKKGLVLSENLEVDLFIPSIKTVIEIDGPAHFFPIWGEKNLQRHIKADAHKSGLLLNDGMVVIRVKHLTKNLSEKHKRDVLQLVIDTLDSIKDNFPKRNNRYIELEVK